MAEAEALPARLGALVRLVAAELVTEVCSVYVMRPGEILELAATEGLRQDAVHRTRLRVGEGIVGTVAAQGQCLNLPDAQNHPAFAYRPETGEEPYASMLAVPVLRAGQVLGVLAVQNRATRLYAEDEVEALETVAMLLAELVAGLARSGAGEGAELPRILSRTLPRVFEGVGLTPGIALGPAVCHGARAPQAAVLATDPVAEQARLEAAIAAMHAGLDALVAGSAGLAETSAETREVLEAYRLIAADAGWLARIRDAVLAGLTAEAAVEREIAELRARMRRIQDTYLRERLADLEDAGGRLLDHLAGSSRTEGLPPGFILLARRLGPAELLDYHARGLAGLLLEEGSPTAHATIIARALEVPLLAGCRGALDAAEAGETAVLDAEEGRLILKPESEIVSGYEASLAVRSARRAALAGMATLPPVTADGVRVSVLMNAGLLADVAHLDGSGADGIGLFRTEIAWLARGGLPDAEAEEAFYARVVEGAAGRPVLFRTIDLGGDKLLPGFPHGEEENPALGWRSLRIGLDRPAMLRRQLRALLRAAGRAAGGGTLRVMFPMVTTVEEFRAAKAMLRAETAALRRSGRAPEQVLAGAMLEVPALVWQLPALLEEVDFLSIGSNDLTQFLFAADRGNSRLAGRYDFLSAPMLDLLAGVAEAGQRAGVPVSLCGEAAARPLEALAVLGIGLRSVSMPASAVPSVKAMVRSLDLGTFSRFLAGLRRSSAGGGSLRTEIAAWARDHGITL
ncbi:MAG: phosphoenolpyruvate--protein phosphotransferase [Rubritepida sp.]|jgi:phosphotransferase system enzyme I (PtsP)|nr:phosphoenolpyruvate--protein phosphotransferase [Rubritepida sp.]